MSSNPSTISWVFFLVIEGVFDLNNMNPLIQTPCLYRHIAPSASVLLIGFDFINGSDY